MREFRLPQTDSAALRRRLCSPATPACEFRLRSPYRTTTLEVSREPAAAMLLRASAATGNRNLYMMCSSLIQVHMLPKRKSGVFLRIDPMFSFTELYCGTGGPR